MMKKLLIFFKKRLIIFVILNIITYIQVARRYPLAEVTPPVDECKSQHRDQLDSKCKMKLPIVTPADYDKVSRSSQTRNIITMLYGATYTHQRDYASGGSPGIDIATSKGTPVYSVGDGTVIYAGERKGGDGKSVSIVHNDRGRTIYSHYSHLDDIQIQKGQKVKAGDKIATVGNTGRTLGKYGNHLDFQIDIKDTYSKMFGYYGCKEGYVDAINNGGCRELLMQYTIDPLKFLADRGATLPQTSLSTTSSHTPPIVHTSTSSKAPPVSSTATQDTNLSPSDSSSHQEMQVIAKQIDGITYTISGAYPQTVLGLKKKLSLTLTATSPDPQRNGVLPETIDLLTSNRNIVLNIETINYIAGKVELIVTAKKIGTSLFLIQIGNQTLAKIPFEVK